MGKSRKERKEFIELLQGICQLLIKLAKKKPVVLTYIDAPSPLGGSKPVIIENPNWDAFFNSKTKSLILAVDDLTTEETAELKKLVLKMADRRASAIRGNHG